MRHGLHWVFVREDCGAGNHNSKYIISVRVAHESTTVLETRVQAQAASEVRLAGPDSSVVEGGAGSDCHCEGGQKRQELEKGREQHCYGLCGLVIIVVIIGGVWCLVCGGEERDKKICRGRHEMNCGCRNRIGAVKVRTLHLLWSP